MAKDVRTAVRKRYAETARDGGSCCDAARPCCGAPATSQSERLGYNRQELADIPSEADLGLGCGNPTALADLAPGETVVDLGSGGGIDCFLAARRVGPEGRVIGVDMTPEMIDRARQAAERGDFRNVEFRLGEIEHLPLADASADVLISNCVINLSPDKVQVFREAYRVLKPGGRLMISDIVLLAELPPRLRTNMELYASCIAGALEKRLYLEAIRQAGFSRVEIVAEKSASELFDPEDPSFEGMRRDSGLSPEELKRLAASVVSIDVKATR